MYQEKEREAIRFTIDLYMKEGDAYTLARICRKEPYALDYLITKALKNQDTLNHIKSIMED